MNKSHKQFIGETLSCVETEMGGRPIVFVWRNQKYRIVQILREWHEFDFSPLAPRKNWKTRRHRNYFQVRTDSGSCFELYCERGTRLESTKRWVLLSQIEEIFPKTDCASFSSFL